MGLIIKTAITIIAIALIANTAYASKDSQPPILNKKQVLKYLKAQCIDNCNKIACIGYLNLVKV